MQVRRLYVVVALVAALAIGIGLAVAFSGGSKKGPLPVVPKHRTHAQAVRGVPIDELGHSPLVIVKLAIKGKIHKAKAVSGHLGQTVAFRVSSDKEGTLQLSGFNLQTKAVKGGTVELRANLQQLSTYTLSFDGKALAVLSVTRR